MVDLQSSMPLGPGRVDMTSHNPADVAASPPVGPRQEQPQGLEQNDISPTAHAPSTSQNAFAAQLNVGLSQPKPQGPYNMVSLANGLPQVPYRNAQYSSGSQQRYNPANSSHMMHQPPHMSQYGPPSSMPVGNQGYYTQHPPHVPQFYGAGHMSPPHSQSSMPSRQSVPYYPNQMVMSGPSQAPYYYPPAVPYAAPNQGMPNNMAGPGQYTPGAAKVAADPRNKGQTKELPRAQIQHDGRQVQGADGRQSTGRGPPRKPRQSGHAIWVGNLPPQTDLMCLVHHVCQAAPGLESLFLISKSNCAFANFKDEATCVDAQHKLHDSKFQSVRLVSRLRKSTVENAGGTTAPTGPSAGPTSTASPSNEETPSASASDVGSPNPASAQQAVPKASNTGVDGIQKDRFFVLKSLTTEDLELSVHTGIWATQSHNEETLNKAFKNADNVYLVFSANKSGEYFGYARMISEINEDPEGAIEFAPKAPTTSDTDLPKAIPTEATQYAPKGWIVDDSARGTIFWEVEREDSGSGSDEESEVSSSKDADGEEETKTWGNPFKLEWLSTNRLPFYRTRGLRNPWNSNREVKIARDGTELEPSVGRRLIGLFNRVHNTGQYGPPMGPPVGMPPGYPQMPMYGP